MEAHTSVSAGGPVLVTPGRHRTCQVPPARFELANAGLRRPAPLPLAGAQDGGRAVTPRSGAARLARKRGPTAHRRRPSSYRHAYASSLTPAIFATAFR